MIELKTRYIALTAAYCAAIFYLSSLSSPPDPGFDFPLMDKVIHTALYAGLAATVSVGIRRSNNAVPKGVQWWAPFGFAVLYGITDEAHQMFVPQRTGELLDVFADAFGAALAQTLLLTGVWRAHKPR